MPDDLAGLNPIVTLSGGNDLLGLLQGYQVEFLTDIRTPITTRRSPKAYANITSQPYAARGGST